jgi:phospholipid/cholesterol/gamma-HCH transport system ATP-binding protein
MIVIERLHKTLSGQPVLRGVDLTVEAGEVLALIGPSGTGKSVLLKHIVGLVEPDSGDVRIDGRSVVRANGRQLAEIRRGLGYVFQDAGLLDSLTLRENLRLALDDADWRRDPAHCRRRIDACVAAVNLSPAVLDRRPGELSGGMRKRAGVARAIINEPAVVLYDEPTTGLDPRNVGAIHDLVLSTRDRLGATSIVITHDIHAVQAFADRVVLLEQGMVRFVGTPAELADSADAAVLDFTGRAAADAPIEEDSWQATRAVTTH